MEDILSRIEQQFITLTKRQKIAADYIIRDPMDTAMSTIDQLAQKAGVSTATIMRLCSVLGYKGYSDMQEELKEWLRSKTDPIKRLEHNFAVEDNNDSLAAKIFNLQMYNLQSTYNHSLEKRLEEAAELLISAKNIYTMGARGSYAIAYYLGHHLNRVCGNADILQETSRLPDYINRIKPNDALVIISLPRSNRQLFIAAQLVKNAGGKIITITDPLSSPYTQISDVIFPVPCRSKDYHNSLLPAMLVSEMLISHIISRDLNSTKMNLDSLEHILNALHTFLN